MAKTVWKVWFAAALVFCLFSCASGGSAPAGGAALTEQRPEASASKWTGDGGAGKSIAILALRASGLADNQSYVPVVMQGEFVSNFSGYSALNVLDRVNLDNQYAELLSGYYDDAAAQPADLGHLIPTDYLMGGSITRTASGYALQITVSRNADKMTAASYSGNLSFAELENFGGIRRASLELLQKLGIQPTEAAKAELSGAAESTHVSAQTALAKGINAQKRGTEVEALSYYFEAAAIDSTLLEASARSSEMSAAISGSNLGENTRNDIAWRREWVSRLTETEKYLDGLIKSNSVPYTLFYSTEIIPGEINYDTETQTLGLNTNLRVSGAWFASLERALGAICEALDATGRKDAWGLKDWPLKGVSGLDSFGEKRKTYDIAVELVNSAGGVIGRTDFRPEYRWSFINRSADEQMQRVSSEERKTKKFYDTVEISHNARENGIREVPFANVKASDITDKLTIRIARVNGGDPQNAALTGLLQIRAISGEEWNSYKLFTLEKNIITSYDFDEAEKQKLFDGNLVIPDVWDEPFLILKRISQKSMLYSKGINNLTIGSRVTFIGKGVFTVPLLTPAYKERLETGEAPLVIPPGVTEIEDRAFGLLCPTIITIGGGVKLGDKAFVEYQNAEKFVDAYRKNGGKAGTYTLTGASLFSLQSLFSESIWKYEPAGVARQP